MTSPDAVLRAALAPRVDAANAALDRLLAQIRPDLAAAYRDGDADARSRVVAYLGEWLPALIELHQGAAVAITQQNYENERDARGIKAPLRPTVTPPEAGAPGMIGWALTANTEEGVRTLLRRGMTNRMWSASRHTVAHLSGQDPASRGWQRVARGTGCLFCRMLASRGAVYTTATVKFSAHDDCSCTAVSAWTGHEVPVVPYVASLRGASKADRKRVRDWMKTHPDQVDSLPVVGDVDRNNQKAHQHELDTADRLASMGLNVKFRRRVSDQKSPDFEIDGVIWEAKSPIGATDNTVGRQVMDASAQSDRVVLDFSRIDRDAAAAVREAKAAFTKYRGLKEMMIIQEVDGQIVVLDQSRRR